MIGEPTYLVMVTVLLLVSEIDLNNCKGTKVEGCLSVMGIQKEGSKN